MCLARQALIHDVKDVFFLTLALNRIVHSGSDKQNTNKSQAKHKQSTSKAQATSGNCSEGRMPRAQVEGLLTFWLLVVGWRRQPSDSHTAFLALLAKHGLAPATCEERHVLKTIHVFLWSYWFPKTQSATHREVWRAFDGKTFVQCACNNH